MPSELGLYCGETYKNQNEVEYTPSISVTQLGPCIITLIT